MKPTPQAARRFGAAFAKQIVRRIEQSGQFAAGLLAGVILTSYLTWGACHR